MVRCGSLANCEERTPLVFRWGMRKSNSGLTASQLLAHARAMPHRSATGFCFWRAVCGGECMREAGIRGPVANTHGANQRIASAARCPRAEAGVKGASHHHKLLALAPSGRGLTNESMPAYLGRRKSGYGGFEHPHLRILALQGASSICRGRQSRNDP